MEVLNVGMFPSALWQRVRLALWSDDEELGYQGAL